MNPHPSLTITAGRAATTRKPLVAQPLSVLNAQLLPRVPLLCLVWASFAFAHGALPATTSITSRHGGNSQLLAGTSFGVLLSFDDGQSWRWICEEAMAPTPRIEPILVWTKNGNILAGDFYGLGISKDKGCTWIEVTAFLTTGVTSVETSPRDPAVLHATTSRYSDMTNSRNGVFVSTDEGETFEPLKGTDGGPSLLREQTYFSGVRAAPSMPSRMYASAWWFTPIQGWLYRTDDEGRTWTEVFRTTIGSAPLTLLAVSPSDADVIFASVDQLDLYQLLRSENGGAQFSVVLSSDNAFKSVEVSSDGRTVYATAYGGMYRSRDGGKTFEKLSSPAQNVCARIVGEWVYACGSPSSEGWVLGRTSNLDAGWSALLRLGEVAGPLECPSGSPVQARCGPYWPALREQLVQYGKSDGGAPQPVSDAGAIDNEAPPSQPQSCGCTETPGVSALCLLIVVLLHQRRRPNSQQR